MGSGGIIIAVVAVYFAGMCATAYVAGRIDEGPLDVPVFIWPLFWIAAAFLFVAEPLKWAHRLGTKHRESK